MSTNDASALDQHPLRRILRHLDKAHDLVIRAYEEREVVLGEGDARRAQALIKSQLLKLDDVGEVVSLSRALRDVFDNALRRHRIEVINTDLSGQVELAVSLVQDLREARRRQHIEHIEQAEDLLRECLDAIYDILDAGSRQAERQVHDNAGTQADSGQRRRMNEYYHQRLTRLTEEYDLVKSQLQEAPFDADPWLVQQITDLLIRTMPVLERIGQANRQITAFLHKDRQREERALKIRAVLARYQMDPGFFPGKTAAKAAKCPGVHRITPLALAAAPDIGPNAETTLYAEDVARLAAKSSATRPAHKKPASEFAGAGTATKTVTPPPGQVLFDEIINQALSNGKPMSARTYWETLDTETAPPGWTTATFLYALNLHVMAGAVTADGRVLDEQLGRLLMTRAEHPLSGTQRLYDVLIYPTTLPEEALPEAVHYERIGADDQ